jgi:hypothetical protein
MEQLKIPQKLVALVKATTNNTECPVKIQNGFSEPINGIGPTDPMALSNM